MTILILMKKAESSPKKEEDNGRKGAIVRHEQFLVFLPVLSKNLYCRQVKSNGLFGKGSKAFENMGVEGLAWARVKLDASMIEFF